MLKKFFLTIIFAGWIFNGAFSAPTTTATNASPLASCTQLLLVTTRDWDAVPGALRRFTRKDATEPWVETGPSFPVTVGRNGLGWGKGLHPAVDRTGPVKKEGDGKSPAGIFRLSSAFGFDPPDKMKQVKLPYRQLTDGVECVDDVKSTNYNSIVDRASMAKADWDSSEKMRGVVPQYRLGIVVDHNVSPREPGGGSCIFLHIWQDARTGTSGCTAMASGKMDIVAAWLDPARHPVLVQLPAGEYQALRHDWQLP